MLKKKTEYWQSIAFFWLHTFKKEEGPNSYGLVIMGIGGEGDEGCLCSPFVYGAQQIIGVSRLHSSLIQPWMREKSFQRWTCQNSSLSDLHQQIWTREDSIKSIREERRTKWTKETRPNQQIFGLSSLNGYLFSTYSRTRSPGFLGSGLFGSL